MQGLPQDIVERLAWRGRIRAAINLGNPVLAERSPDGRLGGISVRLAQALARHMDVGLDLIPFDAAGKVVEAAAGDIWDLAFLARDPVRAEQIAFSAPYLTIEGVYVVRDGSAFYAPGDVDQAGVRVCVGRGAAYDLYLTRSLAQAEIVRCPSSQQALDDFVAGKGDVAAGIRAAVETLVASQAGLRLIGEPFMAIEQTLAVPRAKAAIVPWLDDFLREMKASGAY